MGLGAVHTASRIGEVTVLSPELSQMSRKDLAMTLTFDAELRCLYQSRSICREPAHLVLMPLMIIPIHRAHQYEERVGTLKENLDRKLTLEDLSSLVV